MPAILQVGEGYQDQIDRQKDHANDDTHDKVAAQVESERELP